MIVVKHVDSIFGSLLPIRLSTFQLVNVGNVLSPIVAPVPRVTQDPSSGDQSGLWNICKLREVDVYKVVKDINISKSSGLDNISSFIIKEAFKILSPEVTYMYNLSVETSIFPSAWKEALIVPIPKSGNLTKVQNYRPISLLPLPGKILEKLCA